MKKYFYIKENEKIGPFSLEELTTENFDSETLIWFEGLTQWTPAKEIDEMIEILELKPPPIENQFKPQIFENKSKEKPKTNNKYSNTIGNYIITIIVGYIYVIFDQPDISKPISYVIPTLVGVLFIPALVAGAIAYYGKTKFSKFLAWSTIILCILAYLGNNAYN